MKMKSKNMKRNRLILAAIAGLAFAFPLFAGDGVATNATEAAEIQALKQEIQVLEQKVEALEQRRDVAQQASTNASNAQIQALDQKVRVLERLRENDQDATATVAKAQPRLVVGASGVTFSSADTNFSISLHGVLQVDSRTFMSDGSINGNDSFLLRRARPILQGTVYHDFDFNVHAGFWRLDGADFRRLCELSLRAVGAIAGGQIQIAGRSGILAI